jgi:hypothetical protein
VDVLVWRGLQLPRSIVGGPLRVPAPDPLSRKMKRIDEAELLDELPASDPRAIRSRRDLRRVNFWMGNPIIAAKALTASFVGAPKQIIDLGAGDGNSLLQIVKRTGWAGINVTLVDRHHITSQETIESFLKLGSPATVVAADVFDWLQAADSSEIILANLFLHHFDDARLSLLLEMISERAELFIAVEPRRRAFPTLCAPLLRLIGCNDVTRHDAVVSIRAGFRDDEISKLWPASKNWRLTERSAGPFSHLFIARRIS